MEKDKPLSFITHPGLILDRTLTVFATHGRATAMKALVQSVRADIQENAKSVGYTPLVLLWYVVGARISGDPSFHEKPEFVNALELTEAERAHYRVIISAIAQFLSVKG
ncbi:hypothetical protein ACQUFY_28125 (plasmid) [Robbsia andropogonis]|uniref:hypothetical protein n=1 Tax=Robbsia andropogonis TaxID=28092 RepID=UPI003D21357C